MQGYRGGLLSNGPAFVTGHGVPKPLSDLNGWTSIVQHDGVKYKCSESSETTSVVYEDGYVQPLSLGVYFLGSNPEHTFFYLWSDHDDPISVFVAGTGASKGTNLLGWVSKTDLTRTHEDADKEKTPA
jgi:hypothetical protein